MQVVEDLIFELVDSGFSVLSLRQYPLLGKRLRFHLLQRHPMFVVSWLRFPHSPSLIHGPVNQISQPFVNFVCDGSGLGGFLTLS